MRTPPHLMHRQSGIVLIVSLFILVLLTIIGVSGMKVTSLEEKMAGNDRDENVAFQAAETALRVGEARAFQIYNTGDLSPFCDATISTSTSQQGLFSTPIISATAYPVICPSPCPTNPAADCVVPAPLDSATWASDAQSVPIGTANLLTGTSARYYITFHSFKCDHTDPSNPIGSYFFTITARGTGAKGGEVILRSYFGAPTVPRGAAGC